MYQYNIIWLLNLRKHTVFKTFGKTQTILLYWFAAQQQPSTSRGQKCDFFIKILVHYLMRLILSSKSDMKLTRMSKTKTVRQTTYM